MASELLGGGPLLDSECHCCSTQRVVDPHWPEPQRLRQVSESSAASSSFFRRRKRTMVSIYVDSRKRVDGDDASFSFDIGETIHLQTGAKLSIFKLRVADAFLSTDRGQYLFWRA